MKGDPDTKYLVKEIYVYSDGSERVVEIKPNPDAAEIVRKVAEARAELEGEVEPEVSASEEVELLDKETLYSTED